MQTGQISYDHPLDEFYKKKFQDHKRMKNNLLPTSSNNNSFVQASSKADDPLIKAEIEKNIREQKKILQQDLVRSLEEIDKNFELKKKEI